MVNRETVVGDSGPVAVNSRLGWLLSGPSNNSGIMSFTHSNVIVNCNGLVRVSKGDELVNTLTGFWDIKSIGILDDSQGPVEEERFFWKDWSFTIASMK